MEWCILIGGKKFRTVLIVAVCAAAAVAGIRLYLNSTLPEHTPSNMETQEHTQQPEDVTQPEPQKDSVGSGEVKEIRVGEEIFLAAIQETLDGQMVVSNLSAEISEEQGIMISGLVSKEEVANVLASQADSISSAYQTILGLLPDELPLTLQLSVRANETGITVAPQSFQVATMEIPGAFIGEDMFQTIEQNVNREISKQVSKINSIATEDGGLRITGT